MYTVIHSCLTKNVPSQNPPSNVNPHISVTLGFLIGRYPYHQSQSESNKQQGKKELHYVLCATHVLDGIQLELLDNFRDLGIYTNWFKTEIPHPHRHSS